jgi:hypothetical protein
MSSIESYLTRLSCSSVSQGLLDAALKANMASLPDTSRLPEILDRFGSDVLEMTAEAILRFLG